jgi:membrane-bound lytic murein transglycosylase A
MAKRFLILLTALLLLAGCAAPTKKPSVRPVTLPPQAARVPPAGNAPALVRVASDRLPHFTDDMDLQSLEAAVGKSLSFYERAGRGPQKMGDAWATTDDLRESLVALREILRLDEPDEVKQRKIQEGFDVYQSKGLDGKNTVLITGYFEAIMDGSLVKTERHRYPLYRTPDDAVRVNLGLFREAYRGEMLIGRMKDGELIPYYSRSEIEEQGALAGRDLELAWVEDRIGLFFLHTQGSGKIRLPNGELLQVGYALKNGRPFRSVRTYLLDSGRIAPQESSYRDVKRYLREHPGELPEILGYNGSFVFFRVVREGPVGSIGEILTPGRSIATDAAIFPQGALAFLRARKPVLDKEGNVERWIPFSRFVVSQDTGGVIKGAGRVDLFCGSGDEAEMLAGSLAERGELYFLLKKRPDRQGQAGSPGT